MITIKINKNGNIKELNLDCSIPEHTTFTSFKNVVLFFGLFQSIGKLYSLHNPKQLEFNFNA